MKRKLTLSFEDDKIISISLFERGKRSKLLPIACAEEATTQVADLLMTAIDATLAEQSTPAPQKTAESDANEPTVEDVETETTQSLNEDPLSLPYSVCARARDDKEMKGTDD